jgi:diaminopimelate epimerase
LVCFPYFYRMQVPFFKYEGAGNDFILVDNRQQAIQPSREQIAHWCHRHLGIGSDGLILIEDSKKTDFKMVFLNPDGSQGFCGNGSRCAVDFANRIGLTGKKCTFEAIDGIHQGEIIEKGMVSITMQPVDRIIIHGADYILNTGSPHFVRFLKRVMEANLIETGRSIRYSKEFAEEGINVNLVERKENTLISRTYERGVEDETLSCGTGVTAVALAAHHAFKLQSPVAVETRGGLLSVSFEEDQGAYSKIVLTGPIQRVFNGVINYHA